MYQPPHFKEERLEVQLAAIKAHPFGLLISHGADGLVANGVPFIAKDEGTRLLAHLSRGNSQCRGLDGQQVLVVFQGPQAYISPSHYETKRETGKVVPTWNYVMVQVKGVARVHEEPEWILRQVTALTQQQETGYKAPWQVSDAPEDYLRSQLKGIVGVEIEISTIEGKWKMSQNQPEANRRGVIQGLAETSPEVAALVKAAK